jgi:hypothetical protein
MCVYGVLSIGLHLHLHYCCGKLSDVGLFETRGCCEDQSENTDNSCSYASSCCTFENFDFKINEGHYATFFKTFPLKAIDLVKQSLFVSSQDIIVAEKTIPIYHIEPDDGVPIYLRLESLKLYA